MSDTQAVYWATQILNQRCKWAEVPEAIKPEVNQLCRGYFEQERLPVTNRTFRYEPTSTKL